MVGNGRRGQEVDHFLPFQQAFGRKLSSKIELWCAFGVREPFLMQRFDHITNLEKCKQAFHIHKSSQQHLRGKQEEIISTHPRNCGWHWLILR